MQILDVHVIIENSVSLEAGPRGSVTMIAFGGTVSGLIDGVVEPGGVDTQTVDETGRRRMSARYMLSGALDPSWGVDGPVRLFVENDGSFADGNVVFPFHTVPTFLTDCEGLAEYLDSRRWVGEGVFENGELHIRFYEDGSME